MSRIRNPHAVRAAVVLLIALSVVFPGPGARAEGAPAAPDRVALKDGSTVEGRVLSLDAHALVIDARGERRTIARKDVARIELGDVPPSPLVVRVKVAEADDEVRLYLDDKELAPAAQLRAEWFDLTPLLGNGPHRLTAEVVNRRGPRAWRWVLDIGGKQEVFACGLAGRSGCTADGQPAVAQGTFPAGEAWLFVNQAERTVELQRPPAP